ncbi:MAG: ATP-binding protein [candidate division Zixibacteria bacterium]|nr:ATP-binding protein [candidate division Zixibacteria bacterium]
MEVGTVLKPNRLKLALELQFFEIQRGIIKSKTIPNGARNVKTFLKVLLVEDSEDDSALLIRQLEQSGFRVDFRRVETAPELEQALQADKWDLIFFDYILPRLDAARALEIVRRRELQIPFIVVSGRAGEEAAVSAIKAGAHDYLVKGNLARLPAVVERELNDAEERQSHRKIESVAREIKRQLATLIDNLPGAVYRCVYDRDSTMEYLSEGIEELTGYKNDELLTETNLTYQRLIHPEDRGRVWEEVRKAVSNCRPYVLEYRIKTKSGDSRWVSDKGRAIFKSEGEPQALEGFILDASQKKYAEESKDRQLQMKDQFLSHVSHELRTPLSSIYQFITLLLDGLAGEINKDQREYLEIALRNAIQLRVMINDLLDVTRAEVGKLTIERHCTYLGGAITKILQKISRQASANGIELRAEFPSDLPPVYADPARVQQILNNLIKNALKFTSPSGKVIVRATLEESDKDYICVSISDTGSGIEPEEKDRIFDYLYQGKTSSTSSRKGLGLGLYICKELVNRQGGKIWVKSQPRLGSVFCFTLPVFSLASVLRPVVLEKGEIRRQLSLIKIKVSGLENSTGTGVGETFMQEIWNTLERCIYPDRDVLLPKLATDRQENLFFIVASAGSRESEILIHRIEDQIQRNDILSNARLKISPTVENILLPPERPEQNLALRLQNLARQIFNQMQTHLIEGGKKHVR